MDSASASPAHWNFQALHVVTDGNTALEEKLMSLYIQTVDRCLERLQKLVHQDLHNDWPKVVHELRGASANIHAEQMAHVCKLVERADDPITRKLALENLEAAYTQLRPVINSVISLR